MTKNRIPVDQLEGVELDLWVASSQGEEFRIDENSQLISTDVNLPFKIAIDWNYIGPCLTKSKEARKRIRKHLELNNDNIELDDIKRILVKIYYEKEDSKRIS